MKTFAGTFADTFEDTLSDKYTCTSDNYVIIEDCVTSLSVYKTTIKYDKSMSSSFIFDSSSGTSTGGYYKNGWGDSSSSTLYNGNISIFQNLPRKKRKSKELFLLVPCTEDSSFVEIKYRLKEKQMFS
jgi:hypothetical protein